MMRPAELCATAVVDSEWMGRDRELALEEATREAHRHLADAIRPYVTVQPFDWRDSYLGMSPTMVGVRLSVVLGGMLTKTVTTKPIIMREPKKVWPAHKQRMLDDFLARLERAR